MKQLILSVFLILPGVGLMAQVFFSELAPMPERVSNNAVASAEVDGEWYVYSFAGIDSTKIYSGIHKKAWRYSVANDEWEAIDPLPSGNGRIAAGASRVKDKIYIIGGYEVFSNGNEASFDEVHIYDPATNQYLANGAPCPVPIDDQVQAVWRDSLIYLITGWSNNGNVPTVQIYNPTEDSWIFGTSTPNNNDYTVFGASGMIIGDNIYYMGGASGACCNPAFPPTDVFRMGAINPDDPTDITWSDFDSEWAIAYRPAVITDEDGNPVWVGGADLTYNYNGIDYNGSGGVEPRDTASRLWLGGIENLDPVEGPGGGIPVMDLRGAGDTYNIVGTVNWIIAGGMEPGQQVSNKTYEIQVGVLTAIPAVEEAPVYVFPNPVESELQIQPGGNYQIQITTIDGRMLLDRQLTEGESLDVKSFAPGVYFLSIRDEQGRTKTEKIIIH